MVIFVKVTAILGTFAMREIAFAKFSKDPSSSGLTPNTPNQESIMPSCDHDHALEAQPRQIIGRDLSSRSLPQLTSKPSRMSDD